QWRYLPSRYLKGSLNSQTIAGTWNQIWEGSWGGIHFTTLRGRDKFFNNLLNEYIERDIVPTGIRHLDTFKQFLKTLASKIGQELQVNAIASAAGISTATVKEWLSLVEDTGLIYLLPAFPNKIESKSIIKEPKLYFTDTGLAAWLCQISTPEALRTIQQSNFFFENFVVIELLKSWFHSGKNPRFYHYRDTKGNTIDLLIKNRSKYYPINIETTVKPQASMVKDFDLIKGEHIHRGYGALICLCEKPEFLSSDVMAHSIWSI
ncbi:MAG: DUF4143 domain-containing protein, partial [Burkholderiales bacterium]|nr:DUF4143 domain-containing protein [Burkholderiales bacterium]